MKNDVGSLWHTKTAEMYSICCLCSSPTTARITNFKKRPIQTFSYKNNLCNFFCAKNIAQKIMHTFMCKKIGAFKIAHNILHNLSADAGIKIVYQYQYNSTRI